EAVLEWCADAGAAAIPFGGGTSVVGGVEARVGDDFAGTVSVDLRRLDRVLEIDAESRAARIQAGALGPALEDQLRPHDLTVRHFPQSFEFSTLGGWIATRSGGHFATLYTHIDDLVESVRAITPSGAWESRRLPGSGAGPSPDRMLIGSEGILGMITEAWVRVQERPRFKASVGVAFEDFDGAAGAVREISQSGLNPSNCRLLDAAESELTHAGPEGKSLLVLGFESAHHPVEAAMDVALEAARDHGGEPGEVSSQQSAVSSKDSEDVVGAWRQAFLAAPYLRDNFVALGVLSDTFETAVTWDRFEGFHERVMETARASVAEVSGAPAAGEGSPRISCRFTHVYPDGPAPYFTFHAMGRADALMEQWRHVKQKASDAVIEGGGTITHHHAVGRDHMPWYERQRPKLVGAALAAAKQRLDPAGLLNPGVLFAPRSSK
ncbi:MAG: FAD-binding oxidoreductase, partial [Gemmatimonadaceae bacterium]